MATRSFSFKQTTNASVGSFLQQNPALLVDDDSMLRGDGFISTPSVIATDNTITVDVSATSYTSTEITWEVGIGLSTTPGATPTPTRFLCVYDPNGYPQTVGAGITLFSSQSASGTFTHTDLLPGKWAYYSFFVLYESSAYRSWYELVGSLEELIPVDHQSTEDLWRRIPRHYRIQDQEMAETPTDQESYGPLHKMLDIFGWDIDRIRTLVDYQMTAKDPSVAEVESLDALAYELGFPIDSTDLGPIRLRNLLNNARINNSIKGTLTGVEQTLSAIAGSPVEITPSRPEILTANQRNFSSIVTDAAPTGSQWSYTTATNVTCSAYLGGLAIVRSSGTGYVYTVVTTAVPISQASRYRSYYDVLNNTGASVAGAYMSTTFTGASSWTVDGTTGFVSSGPATWVRQTSGTVPWYQAPQDHGIIGDGTFSSGTAYLHIVVVLAPGATSLLLRNPSVTSLNIYPYTVDVYSERVNLLKDPKFANPLNTSASVSATNYWNTRSTGGSVVATKSSAVLTSTAASVSTQEVRNLGSGGAVLNARVGSTTGVDTNDPRLLAHSGTNYLYLPGLANNYASTINAAPLNITGAIEIVGRVSGRPSTDGYLVLKGGAYGDRTYSVVLRSTGAIGFWSRDSAGNSRDVNSSTTMPYTGNTVYWVKVTADPVAGEIKFYHAADQPTEPSSWTPLGTTQTATFTGTAFASNTTSLLVGNVLEGGVYRTIIRNGIGGTVAFDVNFTTGITSGGQTELIESSTNAATVTINRNSTGRKAVAVVQPTLLFGTTDYLNIDDNNLLDISATDSATVMVASRIWGTPTASARFFHKGATTGARWGLSIPSSGALNRAQGFLSNGVAATVTAESVTFTAGSLFTASATFDRSTQQITSYIGTAASTPSTSIAGLSAENSASGRVGSNANTNYIDMEFFGAAIWRRTLTATELALVDAHYQTGPTAQSRALLSEAALWIDPARSVAAEFYLNDNVNSRLKPLRTGIEYNFSVIDSGSTIQEVRLVSRAYGTIATATTPYREDSSLDGTRRYYALLRPYEDPWLPLNVEDCYIEIVAWLQPNQTTNFKQPMLEPLLRGGEYFDGDSINGGWLKGEGFNGTADYRWGGSTANQAFSYYATDYVRMRQAIIKMMPFVVPATETGISVDNGTLRFNRLFGYTGTDMP